jgi:hypothetical protein
MRHANIASLPHHEEVDKGEESEPGADTPLK